MSTKLNGVDAGTIPLRDTSRPPLQDNQMPKRKRPVEMPVPSDLRDALLELAVEDGEVTTSVKALVEEARSALSKVNAALASSSLAGIVVREMVRANKKRGSGTIRADARGVLTLYLGKEDPVEDVAMPHTTAPGGAGLPSLDVLRDLADQRGVDISDLGRRKRDIMHPRCGVSFSLGGAASLLTTGAQCPVSVACPLLRCAGSV